MEILDLPSEMIREICSYLDEGSKWILSSANNYLRKIIYDKYENSPVSTKIKNMNIKIDMNNPPVVILNDIYMPGILHYARSNKRIKLFKKHLKNCEYYKGMTITSNSEKFKLIIEEDLDEFFDVNKYIHFELNEIKIKGIQTRYLNTNNLIINDNKIRYVLKMNDMETWNLRFFILNVFNLIDDQFMTNNNLEPDKLVFNARLSSTQIFTKDKSNSPVIEYHNNILDIYRKYKHVRFIFCIVYKINNCELHLRTIQFYNKL